MFLFMSNWSDLKNNPRLKNIYETRLHILRLMREFFWSEGFVEADSPIALRLAGQEPYLNPMEVVIKNSFDSDFKFYLRTSPEYALKKILAAGWSKVFEISKCFRNQESFGGTHNPEFTMVEWYRSPGTYWDFMDDSEAMFKYVGEKLGIKNLCFGDLKVDYLGDWDRKSVKDLWMTFLGKNLDDYLSVDAIGKLVVESGLQFDQQDKYEDLFYKLFLNKIEPNLGLDKPVFVYDYPAQMCSLSKLCEHDDRYAQRAELYVAGLELANGFGELTDFKLQKINLEKDKTLRTQLGKPTWPVDEDFIAALKSGINTAGGIALGVDRMVLLFTGARDINEVIFQSVADQVNN